MALIGPELTVFYWESKGSSLSGRDPIRSAFDEAAPNGWSLISITLQLQATSDGHSCGDWAHWFRCRVLAYVAEGKVGSHTFPEFLQAELSNLRLLKGTALRTAETSHRRFITKRRDDLRQLLRSAARQGMLPWGISRLNDFTVSGAAEEIDLCSLDE